MDEKREGLKGMISAMTEEQFIWFIAQARLLLDHKA